MAFRDAQSPSELPCMHRSNAAVRRPLDLHQITSRNLAAAVLPSVAGGPLGFQEGPGRSGAQHLQKALQYTLDDAGIIAKVRNIQRQLVTTELHGGARARRPVRFAPAERRSDS
jgi:hypothetical protein